MLDPHKLKFTFKTRNSMKPLLTVAQSSPLPRHWWNANGRDITKTTLEPLLGNGAYRIKAVDPGRSITYERVADYWAADLPVNRGLNNFDQIRYDYYLDDTVLFEAFMAGRIDYVRKTAPAMGPGLRRAGGQGRQSDQAGTCRTKRPGAHRAISSTCAGRSFRMSGSGKRSTCCTISNRFSGRFCSASTSG